MADVQTAGGLELRPELDPYSLPFGPSSENPLGPLLPPWGIHPELQKPSTAVTGEWGTSHSNATCFASHIHGLKRLQKAGFTIYQSDSGVEEKTSMNPYSFGSTL